MKRVLLYIFMLSATAATAQDSLLVKHSVSANITNVLSWGSGFNILEHISYNYRLTYRKQLLTGAIFQLLRSKPYEYGLIGDADMRIGVFAGYSYSFIRENRKSYWKIGGQFWYGQGDFLYTRDNVHDDFPYYTASAVYGIAEISKVKRYRRGWNGQFTINLGIKHLYGTGIKTNHPVLGLGFALSKNLFAAKASRNFDSVSKTFFIPKPLPAQMHRDITRHSISINYTAFHTHDEGLNFLARAYYSYRFTPKCEITAGLILEPYKPEMGGYRRPKITSHAGVFIAYTRNFIFAEKKGYWKLGPQFWYTVGKLYKSTDVSPQMAAYYIIEAARVAKLSKGWALQVSVNIGLKSPNWLLLSPPAWGAGITVNKDF